MVCDQQSLRSACASRLNILSVKLLTEHHLEFLCLKRGCTGSPESTFVKMPHCWKSHVVAHISCANQEGWDRGSGPPDKLQKYRVPYQYISTGPDPLKS